MNFENKALIEFLRDIYNESNEIILSSQEVKDIEKFYKDNYKKVETFDEFLLLDRNIARKIKKVKGVYAEVERQFKSKKALQPGTLIECVLAQTIANMYNLSMFADLFHTVIRDVPANVVRHLRTEENNFLGRYIYYDPNNTDNFLIQYGNPTSYDADLFLDNNIVKLEFKDRIARAGEKDIKKYDENGKLLIDDNFKIENPEYIPLIEQFNEETDIFSRYINENENVNFNNFDEEVKRELLKGYFNSLGIDSLVTLDDNNQIIAITIDCVDENENFEIISTNGSEIRPAGKNPGKVFTPAFLEQSIEKIGGSIDNRIVTIPSNNMTNRIGRGTGGEITGKKINNLLFITIEKVKDDGENCIFKIEDVSQLKPTVAVHIKIIVEKENLYEYYNEILSSYNE